MLYCLRCGKKLLNNHSLKRHLKIKKKCNANYLNIPDNEIVSNYKLYINSFLEMLPDNQKYYKHCNLCMKGYNKDDEYEKHIIRCKKKNKYGLNNLSNINNLNNINNNINHDCNNDIEIEDINTENNISEELSTELSNNISKYMNNIQKGIQNITLNNYDNDNSNDSNDSNDNNDNNKSLHNLIGTIDKIIENIKKNNINNVKTITKNKTTITTTHKNVVVDIVLPSENYILTNEKLTDVINTIQEYLNSDNIKNMSNDLYIVYKLEND